MYAVGVETIQKMDVPRYRGLNVEDFVVAGLTYPVSVKQLHLHLVLPPFKHEKVFLIIL